MPCKRFLSCNGHRPPVMGVLPVRLPVLQHRDRAHQAALTVWFLAIMTQHKGGIIMARKRHWACPTRRPGCSSTRSCRPWHSVTPATTCTGAWRSTMRMGGEWAGSINDGRKAANKSAFVAALTCICACLP